MNAVGRRLSESRVRENLMQGLRWQAMEMENTAPLPDPTSHGYLPPSVVNHKLVPVMVWSKKVWIQGWINYYTHFYKSEIYDVLR